MPRGNKKQRSKLQHKGIKQKQIMPRNYNFLQDVRNDSLYKESVARRDPKARKELEAGLQRAPDSSIIPGQLIMFNYLSPATMEELEYWDAMPVTIFFGHIKNKEGKKRVLGFNIHYYPPRIRYRLMNYILKTFRSFYKSWQNPVGKEIRSFAYADFMKQLKSSKLDFGVRMYDPNLMGKVTPIPPVDWSKAVFTEGMFKRTTRNAIMNYWKNWVESKKY